jgi:hypothetical protein
LLPEHNLAVEAALEVGLTGVLEAVRTGGEIPVNREARTPTFRNSQAPFED